MRPARGRLLTPADDRTRQRREQARRQVAVPSVQHVVEHGLLAEERRLLERASHAEARAALTRSAAKDEELRLADRAVGLFNRAFGLID